MQLRFMQELAALYTYLRSRRLATRRKPRSAWVFPRPQNWFEQQNREKVQRITHSVARHAAMLSRINTNGANSRFHRSEFLRC